MSDPKPTDSGVFAARRDRLLGLLDPAIEILVVSLPIHVTYLTGFSGESSYLLLGRRHCLLVSDARFTEQIQEECPGLQTYIRPPAQTLPQAVAENLNSLGIRRIGYESAYLTVAEWEHLRELTPTLDWVGVKTVLEKLRAIKDETELRAIRQAIRIAERAFQAFTALLRPGDTEKELSDRLEHFIRWAGGKCSSFPSIVAIGSRASLPHAPPTDRRIEEGEFVLVDWGASGPFYKSDLTRVLATRRISPKLEEVHAVVLAAQQRAVGRIRPGATGQEIDAEARAALAESGYAEFFTHGLGHGIGLQVHEAPALRPKSETILEPGMVVTVEPGVYIPGWGGVRIEDDVLVTPDGCEVLTSVNRELRNALA